MLRTTLAVALASLIGLEAQAQSQLRYDVELIGGQRVPPNASGGIGQATVTVDTVTRAISLSGQYSNLGAARSIHRPR